MTSETKTEGLPRDCTRCGELRKERNALRHESATLRSQVISLERRLAQCEAKDSR